MTADADARPGFAGKVLCGYQGWFRCPGDPVTPPGEWFHWFRRAGGSGGGGAWEPTFEMWPDLSECDPDETYPAPEGYTDGDGQRRRRRARLFSSAHPKTVRRHFEWMRRYGIDGVLVQRFLVHAEATDFRGYGGVLPLVRRAAREAGRVWCVEYDLSGAPEGELRDRLARDWERLTGKEGVADDPGYLHEGGKPVLAIWGFFPDRFSAATAHRILDHFEKRAWVVGGVNWPYRRDAAGDPEWQRLYRRFDALSPWNVGHAVPDGGAGGGGVLRAGTQTWAEDLAACEKAGQLYVPVLYPGFRWNNLKKLPPETVGIPRRKGDFLREQFAAAERLGLTTLKVAMFDEVDEATAIFKVTNDPPAGPAPFLTLDGLPPDAYLKLVGEATRGVHARRAAAAEVRR